MTYYVDPSGSATLTLKAGSITDAVKKAFQGYDDQVTYTLFAQTTTPSAAKIKVQWKYINGTLKQAPSFYKHKSLHRTNFLTLFLSS
ncbi:MAG: hypothetical protein ACRD5J_07780 [Nitrososphaeraceae archaeon]